MTQKSTTKQLAVLSIIIAFNVALSYIVKIPVPATNGFVNLVEAGIFIAAMLGGARSGMIVGGLSGLLLDLFAGYPQWMIFSLIIHGLEGYLVGYFGYKKSMISQIFGLICGAIVMVVGYMLAGVLLYNWAAGLASIIGNTAQVVMGLIVSLVFVPVIKRMPQTNLKH